MLVCTGCVASYTHLDPTPLDNDGAAYDLLCGEVEKNIASVRLRGGLCSNVASNGGEFLRLSVEYRFDPRNLMR